MEKESAAVLAKFSRKYKADKILKCWCAYYDPDKKSWGNPSKCLHCARNPVNGDYDPSQVFPGNGSEGTCKRAHIIAGVLPAAA